MINISVVIPTFDRSDLLRKTLASIAQQQYPQDKFEVIIADNGGNNIKSTVDEFARKINNLVYIQVSEAGLHHGRHAGMQKARGSILVFADDDIEALPSWLEGIDESFQDNTVGLVGGKNIPNYESDPPEWIHEVRDHVSGGWYITYFSVLDLGENVQEINPHFVFGCNFAIRTELLKKIGGFHPDALPPAQLKFRGDGETHVAEQVEFLKYKTVYNPKASVYHWVPTSRLNKEYLHKRAYAEGITQSFRDIRMNRSKRSSIVSFIRKIKQSMRFTSPAPLKKDLQKSFHEGYKFHQAEVKKDPELMKWVLRDDYL